jgi:hypothetical protein
MKIIELYRLLQAVVDASPDSQVLISHRHVDAEGKEHTNPCDCKRATYEAKTKWDESTLTLG